MDPDAEADFTDFVASRSPDLMRTAYLLSGDRHRAEDLLQSALTKAHRHWARIRRGGAAEPYVKKIMLNEQRSWWNRRGRRETLVAAVPDRAAASAHQDLEERDAMWRALQDLPPRTRAVLVLRYWEDLSERDTAELLGCSTGSVKSQASRGLRRLAAVLDASARPSAAAPRGGAE